MTLRLRPYEAAPDTRFGTAVLEHGDGREARIAWIRLPIFGYELVDYGQRYAWCQRVLVYHGWHGFSLHWRSADPTDGRKDV